MKHAGAVPADEGETIMFKEAIQKIRQWWTQQREWTRRRGKKPPVDAPAPVVAAPEEPAESEEPAPATAVRWNEKIGPPEPFGPPKKRWFDTRKAGHLVQTSIHDILDMMPDYFDDLKALKKVDLGAYNMFSRLGGQLGEREMLMRFDLVTPEFIKTAPTVRAVFMAQPGDENDGKFCTCRIIYLMRVGNGRLVVDNDTCVATPKTGLNYRLITIYRIKGEKRGLPVACYVNIDANGRVKLLSSGEKSSHRLPKRGGDFKRKEKIPWWLKEFAADRNTTPEEHLQLMVSLCASACRPDNTILVRAYQDGAAAAWLIDRKDAKRFFRKRETGLADDGRRKRVLHYVEPFVRVAEGKEQGVRGHYRGEREFDWNGYQVKISGLGFHHGDFFDAPIATYDDIDCPPGRMETLSKVSKMIAKVYNQPKFLSSRSGKRHRAA